MCGIVGVKRHHCGAMERVLAGLEILEYRGYDSWGIAGLTQDGRLSVTKQVGNVRARSKEVLPVASLAIGHTRWATHGGVNEINAHPHMDTTQRFVVVHNGVIENWSTLKATLPATCRYASATDTEIIPHLLSLLPDSISLTERLMQVGSLLAGQNAFVVLDTQTQTLGAACFGSPLLLGQGKKQAEVVSDVLAFGKMIDGYYALTTGQVAVLQDFAWKVPKTSLTWIPVPPAPKKYHQTIPGQMMLHELQEAPAVIIRSSQTNVTPAAVMLTQAKTVWLTGAGTAYHAALLGAHWLRTHGITATAFPASEYHSFVPIMKPREVLVLISQSGETRDTLLAGQAATKRKVSTLALVNRPYASLTRAVDRALLTSAGPEQAVLATKSLVAQLLLLWRLASGTSERFDQIANDLQFMWRQKLYRSTLDQVASLLTSSKWIPIIGEGSGWMMALEAALKFKEGAYIPAEGMAGGELKHGTLALIESGTHCLILDIDPTQRLTLQQHAIEMKARGGIIIGISPFAADFDYGIPIPDRGPMTWLSGLVTMQYLAYLVAIKRGINPDRPRNLAKSVTVI